MLYGCRSTESRQIPAGWGDFIYEIGDISKTVQVSLLRIAGEIFCPIRRHA